MYVKDRKHSKDKPVGQSDKEYMGVLCISLILATFLRESFPDKFLKIEKHCALGHLAPSLWKHVDGVGEEIKLEGLAEFSKDAAQPVGRKR